MLADATAIYRSHDNCSCSFEDRGAELLRASLSNEQRSVIGQYDHVTHLPNRLQFIADLPALGNSASLLVLVTLADAKHYNEVLRALGHAFAEDFVREGARMLRGSVGRDVSIYHVSVLSFAFVLETDTPYVASPVVTGIAAMFGAAVSVEDIPIKTRVGIGLLPLIEPGIDGSEALRAALAAAQDSRRIETAYAFYDHRSDAAHLRAFRILADLPAALADHNQLSLYFQPRISLKTNRTVGAEALLRWNHPELGNIPPGEFVPLVEQTALIGPLTDWVLDAALAQRTRLPRQGAEFRLSVNAAPTNLAESGFDDKVLGACRRHGVSPHEIEIEFTEGTLSTNLPRTVKHLKRLRAAGITVAIDDFGAGYSNLGYLTQIPADVLKIDQAFVRPLGTPSGNDYLLRQIVVIGKGLGFTVCAEGIETGDAYALLQSLDCDEGQGYFMARPMPAAAFETWLRTAGPHA